MLFRLPLNRDGWKGLTGLRAVIGLDRKKMVWSIGGLLRKRAVQGFQRPIDW